MDEGTTESIHQRKQSCIGNRCPSRVKREIQRNASRNAGSRAGYAAKASRKEPDLKIGKDHKLCKKVEELLQGIEEDGRRGRGYSLDAVVMKLDQEGCPSATRLSTRTIYNYVEQESLRRSRNVICHEAEKAQNADTEGFVDPSRCQQESR